MCVSLSYRELNVSRVDKTKLSTASPRDGGAESRVAILNFMSIGIYRIHKFFVVRWLFCWGGSTAGAGVEGEEGEAGSSDGEVLVSGGAPFETHLWRARQAIQLATDAMLAAYEV